MIPGLLLKLFRRGTKVPKGKKILWLGYNRLSLPFLESGIYGVTVTDGIVVSNRKLVITN